MLCSVGFVASLRPYGRMVEKKGSKFKSEIGEQTWSKFLRTDCRSPNSLTSNAKLDPPVSP
jgi:hypothetical protein